jgi:hypothetical protein
MVRHLLIVATAFRVSGLVIAVASLLALADLAETALVMRKIPPPDKSAPLDIGTYGLVALISNAARGLDHVFHALAGVASSSWRRWRSRPSSRSYSGCCSISPGAGSSITPPGRGYQRSC